MGNKYARIVIITLLVCLHAAFGVPQYFHAAAWWPRALTYSFFHASWWHLAVNCLAVWTTYSRQCRPFRDLLVPYLISIAVYPFSLRPVIGFSNVIYAIIGLRTPSLRSRWWRHPSVITFLAVTVAMLFVPRFSATTHIAAFLLGMAGSAIHRNWNTILNEARGNS